VLAVLHAIADVAVGPTTVVFVDDMQHAGRAVAVELAIAQDLLPSTFRPMDRAGAVAAPLVEDRWKDLGGFVARHDAQATTDGRFLAKRHPALAQLHFSHLRRHAVTE